METKDWPPGPTGDGDYVPIERLREAERERDELQALIDLQHRRTKTADKKWQAAFNRPDTLPDLGELIRWLEARAEKAEARIAELERADTSWAAHHKSALAELGAAGVDMSDIEASVSDGIRRLRERAEKAEARIAELEQRVTDDNAVCICGCPESDHEIYDEGESCEDESHDCIRVCLAARNMFGEMRERAEKAEARIAAALRLVRAGASGDPWRWDEIEDALEGKAAAAESEER